MLNDFFFQAAEFKNASEDGFMTERLDELSDVAEGFPDEDPQNVAERAYDLCRRHGDQAFQGYEAMRTMHGDPSRPRDALSLYAMVEGGGHLRPTVEQVAERLSGLLNDGLRRSFQRRRPDHENVLNDEIEALLGAARERTAREFPHIPFATRQSVPDHSVSGCTLLIESKLVSSSRGGVRTAVNQMASDLVLYDIPALILFVVYDPDGLIPSDPTFIGDFERRGRCKVCVVR